MARSAAATGSRRRDLVVYGAGLAQGVVLVSFPAVEPVLRGSSGSAGSSGFGLGSTAYGLLFGPQVVMAIVTSVLGGGLARRIGLKRVFLVGLGADISSMLLLALSALLTGSPGVAYGVLLVATGALGLGYGFVVPSLNSFAAGFHPQAADRALLSLNALLGLGTALAPVFSAVFIGLEIWWGLPLLCVALAVVLLLVALPTPLTLPAARPVGVRSVLGKPAFWLVAGVALAYGVVETMAGNWFEPLARDSLALSATVASVVLAVFWGTVTAGRVVFTLVDRWLPSAVVYRVIPWVAAGGFVLAGLLPSGSALGAVGASALVGLGCSAMLPLTVGHGQQAFPAVAAAMSGLLIAAYEVGYGVAAFGVGPLQAAGLDLQQVVGGSAGVAVLLGVGTLFVVRRASGSSARSTSGPPQDRHDGSSDA